MKNLKNNINASTKENQSALTPLTKISHHGAVDGVTGSCLNYTFYQALNKLMRVC